MSGTVCPKCDNKVGFAFGTCVDCGWNYNSNEWATISVNVEHLKLLNPQIAELFIKEHEYYIMRRRGKDDR